MRIALVVLGALLFLASPDGRSKGTWTNFSPPNHPGPNYGHEMVSVGPGKILYFGGREPGVGSNNDTWIWDGNDWTLTAPPTKPPARTQHTMCYDPVRDRVVLFSGWDGSYPQDTWEWDGTSWMNMYPPASPAGRDFSDIVYDPNTKTSILFGGHNWSAPGSYGDLWSWDGQYWRPLYPEILPPARAGHAMAYDRGRGTIILFGGASNGIPCVDMWEWNGTDWAVLTPATLPPPRSHFAMVYDESRQRLIVHGGVDVLSNIVYSDTWEWDGITWAQTPSIGPAYWQTDAAYHASRREVVIQGGSYSNDPRLSDEITWIYTAGPPLPRIDVRCNGAHGGVFVPAGINVKIDYSLTAGSGTGVPADVWMVMRTPFGPFSYDGVGPFSGWNLGFSNVFYVGPLGNLTGTALDKRIPAGAYDAFFGIDNAPNAVLETGKIVVFDKVDFDVQ